MVEAKPNWEARLERRLRSGVPSSHEVSKRERRVSPVEGLDLRRRKTAIRELLLDLTYQR